MTYPSKPATAYSFTDYQASNPTDPLPGNELDADLAEHKASIDSTIDFVALALRSDGRLQNGSVRPESLSSGTLALITAGGTFIGAWLTATEYAVQDIVTESSRTYVCLVAHTSGTFATDLAAGKWMEIDGNDASLDGNNVFTGTNEFDGVVNFDAAAVFDSTVDFNGAVDFDSSVDLGSQAVAVTPAVGTDSTALATMAALQAAVGRVYIQKFTSVPTTVTVTAATPAVMTWTAHGLSVGQAFQVATSGTLPAGMALTTTYFVISAGFGANSFQFSLTRGGAAINTTDTGSGTHTATPFYVPSTGMVKCIIEGWGGGGGGGGAGIPATASQQTTGGHGGSGGYSRSLKTAADIGASQKVTIGAAGTAGTAGANAGGNGGDTSVGALVIAKGGGGGAAGSTVSGTINAGGAGGVAGTGDVTGTGQRGGTGQTGGVGLAGIAGVGGSTSVGGGGGNTPGGTATPTAGIAATGFGAGGGGGFSATSGSNQAGGAGTAGLAIITEFCNQ